MCRRKGKRGPLLLPFRSGILRGEERFSAHDNTYSHRYVCGNRKGERKVWRESRLLGRFFSWIRSEIPALSRTRDDVLESLFFLF